MSAISTREKRLVIITVLAILYTVVGLMARGRLAAWKRLRDDAAEAREELRTRKLLIEVRDDWIQRYDDVSHLMHNFSADAPTQVISTHWRAILNDTANHAGFNIGSTRPLEEKRAIGNVHEMAFECNDWKGSLEALVNFLYELQAAGVMLDVRTLVIRPDRVPGNLTGRLTLYCAYMRETPQTGNTP